MFRVAVTAGETSTFLIDKTVQFCNIKHLRGNLSMAIRAAICHCVSFPHRNMTSGTFGYLSMGVHAAKQVTCLSIQISCREHERPAGKRNAYDQKQRYKRGDNAHARKTSKLIVFHDASLFEKR
jgi:hypothetical protein